MQFDHLAIAAETLDEGVAWVEDTLGIALQDGGDHPQFGTHNKLLSLGGDSYLEVIAARPGTVPMEARARWFGLDEFQGIPRLVTWVVRVNSFSDALDQIPYPPHEVLSLERGQYRWRMAVPDGGALPLDGVAPKLIAWDGPHPAPNLTDQGVRMERLELSHPDIDLLKPLKGMGDWLVASEGPSSLRALLATPSGPRWL